MVKTAVIQKKNFDLSPVLPATIRPRFWTNRDQEKGSISPLIHFPYLTYRRFESQIRSLLPSLTPPMPLNGFLSWALYLRGMGWWKGVQKQF